MAATPVTNRKYSVAGDFQVLHATLTSVTDGDTFDTGLGTVDNFFLTCNSVGTPISFGGSIALSGGTQVITLDVETNGKEFTITVFGR